MTITKAKAASEAAIWEDEALSMLDFGLGAGRPRPAARSREEAPGDAAEAAEQEPGRRSRAGGLLLKAAAELPMVALFLLLLLALNLLLNPDATVADLAAHAAAGIRGAV